MIHRFPTVGKRFFKQVQTIGVPLYKKQEFVTFLEVLKLFADNVVVVGKRSNVDSNVG